MAIDLATYDPSEEAIKAAAEKLAATLHERIVVFIGRNALTEDCVAVDRHDICPAGTKAPVGLVELFPAGEIADEKASYSITLSPLRKRNFSKGKNSFHHDFQAMEVDGILFTTTAFTSLESEPGIFISIFDFHARTGINVSAPTPHLGKVLSMDDTVALNPIADAMPHLPTIEQMFE
jgi:hypothetical protein